MERIIEYLLLYFIVLEHQYGRQDVISKRSNSVHPRDGLTSLLGRSSNTPRSSLPQKLGWAPFVKWGRGAGMAIYSSYLHFTIPVIIAQTNTLAVKGLTIISMESTRLLPFWKHWWSLQSDWLSVAWFIMTNHIFLFALNHICCKSRHSCFKLHHFYSKSHHLFSKSQNFCFRIQNEMLKRFRFHFNKSTTDQ